jgi:hypothetical protein
MSTQITKEQLLTSLRAILVEERDAIRRLDPVAMEEASDAKEALLHDLHKVPYDQRGPLIEALAELQPELAPQHDFADPRSGRGRRSAPPAKRAAASGQLISI